MIFRQVPTVSVCIPTYNRAEMLRQAIESVLAQSFSDFELIVCDNASEDVTKAIVSSMKDGRIKYFRNQSNLGVRSNWSRCLRESRGEFIAIFPDDDVMMPDNLLEKVRVLTNNGSVGLVHSKYAVMDYDGVLVTASTNKECAGERTHDAIERGRDVLAALLRHNIIHESTVMFRRSCYERLGGFTEQLRLSFDWEYWMRIANSYDIAFIAKPLVKWRRHSGSLTLTSSRQFSSDIDKILPIMHVDLDGLRWVLRQYLSCVLVPKGLRRAIWHQMAGRVVDQLADLIEHDAPMLTVYKLMWKISRDYPEILIEKEVWILAVKSLLLGVWNIRKYAFSNESPFKTPRK